MSLSRGGPCKSISPEMKVLRNHQLLGHVFSFLDLETLKNVRFVCSQWGHEGGRAFPGVKIYLNPSKSHSLDELEQIFTFLCSHRIQHTVTLSLLNETPWFMSSHPLEDPNWKGLHKIYFEQLNDLDFSRSLVAAYSRVSGVGALIPELRLELMCRNEGDAGLVGQILRNMRNLARLSLDLVDYSDEGVRALGKEYFTKITSLGLRVYNREMSYPIDWSIPSQFLDQSSYNYLMELFPSLEFLDFESFQTPFTMGKDPDLQERCLAAITTNKACPKLKGLRTVYFGGKDLFVALASLPTPMAFMDIRFHQRSEQTVTQARAILAHHCKSLQVLKLFWNADYLERLELESQKFKLPKKFAQLTTLSLTSTMMATPNVKEEDHKKLDVFELRALFLNRSLVAVMPFLRNLELIFSVSIECKFWEYIIPEHDKDGQVYEIQQIKTIRTSITTTDCESPQIQRLYRIFPNLRFFHHVHKSAEKLHGCRHKFLDGKQMKVWRTANYAKASLDESIPRCFVDVYLRQVIRMGLQSKERFIY